MGKISLKKYREQMAANMRHPHGKRRRGKFKCKKYGDKFYWYRDSPAKQRKFLMKVRADKFRSRFMPEHKQLIHASLRSNKQLTEEQLTYGRILASSKLSTRSVGETTPDETPSWIKETNSFFFQFKFHGYFIKGEVPVALVGSSSAALEICRKAYKFARRITRKWTVKEGCLTLPSPRLFVIAKMSIRKYINKQIYKHLTK
jgi:hypothetical protein